MTSLTTASSNQFTVKEFKQSFMLMRDQMEWAEFDIPQEKFVEYEPKDREWLEYFGFIKKRPRFDQIHVHPSTMERLRASFLKNMTRDILSGLPVYENSMIPVGECVCMDSRSFKVCNSINRDVFQC